MDNAEVSRRAFLKGAALGAAGVGLMGTGLTGCVAENTAETGSAASESGITTSSEMTPQVAMAQLNPQDYDYTDNSITDFANTTLFSEWSLGSLKLNHRMVKSAAGSAYLPNTTAEEMIAEYTNWAKGGVELIWVEDFVNLYTNYPASYKVFTRENSWLKDLVAAIHVEGSYCGYQLSLMGGSFSGFDATTAAEFESAHADQMTLEELKKLQEDFIDAATFLQQQGFDAIEINAAGNNIGQAFLSRNRNARTDDYGTQNFENRTRFVTEIVQGIKEACGQDFPVQVLINGIEENDVNLGDNSLLTTVAENKEFAKMFEAVGVDGLHVRLGPFGNHPMEFASDMYFSGYGVNGSTGYGTQFDFSRHFEGKLLYEHSGCGMMLGICEEIKSVVSIPVGTVTYMDPAHAPDYFEQALKDGKADFLLMTRPLIVDPQYINKLKEGRIDEIAPCNRCLHCHFDFDEEGNFYEHCRVNACHMRAYHELMPEGFEIPAGNGTKNVIVIGGGPAGMEAARIAAQRGYTVTLYEKNSDCGGLLDFAAAVKGPHENMLLLKNYLKRQLEVTSVTVVTGQEVDAAFVAQQAADVVIVATGGLRDTLGLSETSGTKVVSIDDFLFADIGDEVTIVGENAQAFDVAFYLIAQGKHVTFVSLEPLAALGKGQSAHVKNNVTPMLYARGTRVWPNAEIVEVGDGEITITCETGVNMTFACDTVIEAMDMLPDTSISSAVSGVDIYSIGDCDKPFNIAEAITAGNLTARKI